MKQEMYMQMYAKTIERNSASTISTVKLHVVLTYLPIGVKSHVAVRNL